MKKVTVTLAEKAAQYARVKTVELTELFEKQMTGETAYNEAMSRFLAREPVSISGGKPYPKREELYDRSGLR